MLQRTAEEFNRKEMDLVSHIRDKDSLIADLNAKINELMQEIQNRDGKIAQRDNSILDL
jgi:peptidoglycan hydrolase CwlO-like protein